MKAERVIGWQVGALVAGGLMAQAGPATILTVTSPLASGRGQASLPWFDPALGRLTAVTAEASYASQLPLTFSLVPFGYETAATGTATLNNLTFALTGTAKLQQMPGYWLFGVTETGSATWTDAAVLSTFYGRSGSLGGYASTGAVAPGRALAGNYLPTVSYRISYTYDDSPAVPEPATWAMMAGGFVLIGLALRGARRRQKRSRIADA